MEMRLRTCTLRSWRSTDLEALVRLANNPLIARNLRDLFPHPYTRDAGKLWIEAVLRTDPRTRWAIAVDGEFAGSIGVTPKEREERCTAEIGYWLGEPFWGRGVMTEAVGALTAYAFATFDVVRLEAGVFEGNTASMRVLEKNGYTLEATLKRRVIKDGELKDQLMYARLRA